MKRVKQVLAILLILILIGLYVSTLVFAIIVIDVFRDKGVTDHKQVVQYTAKVGIVAVVLLCLVYGALCFVGSQTSGPALGIWVYL